MDITCPSCGFRFEADFYCTVCDSDDVSLLKESNGTCSIRCNKCHSYSPAMAICPDCKCAVYDIEGDDEF